MSISFFVTTVREYGQRIAVGLWQEWQTQTRVWREHPDYTEYYQAASFVLTLALLLLLAVGLYYLARCVTKTVSWAMHLIFQIALAMMAIVLVMVLIFVCLPAAARLVGLDTWWFVATSTLDPPSGLPPVLSGRLTEIEVGPYVRKQQDGSHNSQPEKKESKPPPRVRLPSVGDSVYEDAQREWGTRFQALTGMEAPELYQEWQQIWESRNSKTWMLWIGLKYGAETIKSGIWSVMTSSGRTIWDAAKQMSQGIVIEETEEESIF